MSYATGVRDQVRLAAGCASMSRVGLVLQPPSLNKQSIRVNINVVLTFSIRGSYHEQRHINMKTTDYNNHPGFFIQTSIIGICTNKSWEMELMLNNTHKKSVNYNYIKIHCHMPQ